MAKFLNRFKDIFTSSKEYFYVLDYGRSSVKVAPVEISGSEKTVNISKISEEIHPKHQDNTDNLMETEQALRTIKSAFSSLGSAGSKSKDLYIGIASEMVNGHTFSYMHKREEKSKELDLREIKNIIHNAEVKAYEDIRKKFVRDSGYKANGVALINSYVQDVKIDGYSVKNPIGFEGSEVQVILFNAYLPKFYKKFFENIAADMKLNLKGIVYEPYAVFNSLANLTDQEFEGIIVDIGGKTTRVSLARKGRFENIHTFSFGGESFTKKIASRMNIGFWEAENIKLRYSRGELSHKAREEIQKILSTDLSLFLNGFEVSLKEFSKTTLLPPNIYLYGGGSSIPLMDGIIKKRKWKQELSFTSPPKLHRLNAEDFQDVSIENLAIPDSQLISILGITGHVTRTHLEKPDMISGILNRMVKLIHE